MRTLSSNSIYIYIYFILQGALADIDTLQSVVDEINTTGEILVSGSEEEFGVELRRELERMNERWAQINQISQQQNKQLKEALGMCADIIIIISRVALRR